MNYFLSTNAALKWLEFPSVYNIKSDELYELDEDSFRFLEKCASETGCSSDKTEFIDYCLKEKLLTKEKVLKKRPPLIKSSFPSLRYLELQITNKCNLKCRHCYIGDIGSNELPSEQIRAVLQEFEEMQGLRVLITGGEPLLHSRFHEINKMLPDFFIKKILFTNGLLLSDVILKSLKVDEIQISIDGLEKAHDSLRGKGAFRSAMDAIRRSIESGFEVSVSTMVHSKNLNDFEGMKELFKNIGIKDWTVDIPCAAGRLKENTDFYVSPEEGGKYLEYGHEGGLHSGASGYACGLYLMSVMATGCISKCTFYADNPVGRIEEGLRECWNKIKPVRLDELKCDCAHIEACRGGCRYRAEILGGPLGKDLYRCFFYDTIKL